MFASSLVLAVGVAYGAGVARLWRNAGVGQGIARGQAAAFACGWLALAAALVSPLDELAERLFAAHMAQHELLMVVAAPLVALASPLVAFMWTLPRGGRRTVMYWVRGRRIAAAWVAVTAPATVWLLHAAVLWIWHMPSLYDAALQHEAVHAVQHTCFFTSAALFWWGLAHGRYGRTGYGVAVVYLFATAVHSGVLGALLAFSPRVWYPLYDRPATTLGLTPLEDQQLAGLLMWVPAGLVFIAGGLYFFAAWLRESERRTRRLSDSARRVAAPIVIAGTIGCFSATACSRDPASDFARLLEKAASWAASVQFAEEMAKNDYVPRTYMHDLLSTARGELDALTQKIEQAKDVDAAARSRAADACRRMTAIMRDADGGDAVPDLGALRAIELRLREAARAARGGG